MRRTGVILLAGLMLGGCADGVAPESEPQSVSRLTGTWTYDMQDEVCGRSNATLALKQTGTASFTATLVGGTQQCSWESQSKPGATATFDGVWYGGTLAFGDHTGVLRGDTIQGTREDWYIWGGSAGARLIKGGTWIAVRVR